VTGGSFIGGTQWKDKSSAANANANQTAAGNLPSVNVNNLNGLNVVTFDGDDYMDVDSAAFGMLRNTTGATIFAVARPTAQPTQGGSRVFMASTGAGSASSRAGFNFFDSFGTSIGGAGDAGLAGRRLDADAYQRMNGGESNLIDYSVERQFVEQYLASKWGAPEIEIEEVDGSVSLSWPVSPVPWRLMESPDLNGFTDSPEQTFQEDNLLKVAEPTGQRMFYRLTRP